MACSIKRFRGTGLTGIYAVLYIYIYIYLFISLLVSSTLCTGIVMIVVLGTKNKRLTFPLPFSSKVPTVSSLLFFSKCKY